MFYNVFWQTINCGLLVGELLKDPLAHKFVTFLGILGVICHLVSCHFIFTTDLTRLNSTYVLQKAEELLAESVLKSNRPFFSVSHNTELPLQWPKMRGQLTRRGWRHSTGNATTASIVTV